MRLKRNTILEDHGDWLLIDISTPKHPNATMAVDSSVFNNHIGGHIIAHYPGLGLGIRAIYRVRGPNNSNRIFHKDVLPAQDGNEIDHINHGSMTFIDNRLSNLRSITHAQNMMNRRAQSNNTSGTKGVHWYKRIEKWMVRINHNGKAEFLGYFSDLEDAISARQRAEKEYFGEYAYNNGEK